MSFNPKVFLAVFIPCAMLLGLMWYWQHPAINLADWRFWFFMITGLFVIVGAIWCARDMESAAPAIGGGIFTVVLLIAVGGMFVSSSFFNPEAYHEQATVNNNTFADDIETVNFSTIPLMDKDTAELIGDRAMGAMADLVSQYDISGNYSQINLGGRPVRVSPLVYDDLWKWVNSKDSGIPGYVRVDMSNENVEIVRTESPIWFTDGEYFERNIYRR